MKQTINTRKTQRCMAALIAFAISQSFLFGPCVNHASASGNGKNSRHQAVRRITGEGQSEINQGVAAALRDCLNLKSFDAVIYTSGQSFVDTLSGGYLAAVKNAPILLHSESDLESNVSYIEKNLSADGVVYVLGGSAAVPETVDAALEAVGINVERLEGSDRYETNIKVLRKAGFGGGKVLICTGQDFADSLSVSATGLPVLVVNKKWDSPKKQQVDFLEEYKGLCEFIVIGGTSAVSSEMEKRLAEYGPITRICGETRYETSVAVADYFFDTPGSVVLAYSKDFADGLVGGPLAFRMKAPLILTAEGHESAAAEYIQRKQLAKGVVLGDVGLIPDGSIKEIFDMQEESESVIEDEKQEDFNNTADPNEEKPPAGTEPTVENNAAEGSPISLCVPVANAADYLGYPKKEDFGEYFDQAVFLYDAIVSYEEKAYVFFPVKWQEDLDYAARYKMAAEITKPFRDAVKQTILKHFYTFNFDYYQILDQGILATVYASKWSDRMIKKMGMTDPSLYYQQNLAAGLYDGMSEKEAVTRISEWICDRYSFEPQPDPVQALQTGMGSCAAYGKTFLAMCKSANIECEYVTGCVHTDLQDHYCCGQGCHAWNRVKIGGVWYYIDTIWMDSTTGDSSSRHYLFEKLNCYQEIFMVFG